MKKEKEIDKKRGEGYMKNRRRKRDEVGDRCAKKKMEREIRDGRWVNGEREKEE